eukprot:2269216-Rhodomonas_salina.3
MRLVFQQTAPVTAQSPFWCFSDAQGVQDGPQFQQDVVLFSRPNQFEGVKPTFAAGDLEQLDDVLLVDGLCAREKARVLDRLRLLRVRHRRELLARERLAADHKQLVESASAVHAEGEARVRVGWRERERERERETRDGDGGRERGREGERGRE